LGDDNLSKQQQSDLYKASIKLRLKVDVLEQRAQLNEVKFHYQEYEDVVQGV
jgi:LETM1 and EF-hand domain-containing protein 1